MTEVETPVFGRTGELCLPSHLRKPRLRRWEASEYLRIVHGIEVATATLAKYASIGGGPPYFKSNRSPLYPKEQLDAWAAKRLGNLVRSSSDTGDAGDL